MIPSAGLVSTLFVFCCCQLLRNFVFLGFLCSLLLSVAELSGRFDFCCALFVLGVLSSAATVGSIVTVLSGWGVCLFSRSGRLSALSCGIYIVGFYECGSFISFTCSIVLFVW